MLISHRGNLNGPDSRENHPDYIDTAIESGYQVEIDLRFDGNFYLGHDDPQYKVSEKWLTKRSKNLWIHCKNIDAAHRMCGSKFRYFCHTNDPYAIIACSDNLIWCHDIALSNTKCVIPLMDKQDLKKFGGKCYAICSDYITYAELLYGKLPSYK